MARAIPQVVRKYEQVTYEREVLGNEPVKEHREPKLIDTKIDVNFYLTEAEAQYLYTALEMGIQAIEKEVKNYGTHPSVVLPGRESISTTDDWIEACGTGKRLADILHDALITAVEHRIADQEPEEREPEIPDALSDVAARLLDYYGTMTGVASGRDTRSFLIKEATEGRTFTEDAVEAAEAELEERGLLQWIVRSDTPEGLVPKLTDAGRLSLSEIRGEASKAQRTMAGKFTDYTHVVGCPRRKQTGMACVCPDDAPKFNHSEPVESEPKPKGWPEFSHIFPCPRSRGVKSACTCKLPEYKAPAPSASSGPEKHGKGCPVNSDEHGMNCSAVVYCNEDACSCGVTSQAHSTSNSEESSESREQD